MMDTIIALASGQGRAGVSVLRISGPSAQQAAKALCGSVPPPREAGLRRLMHGEDILDQALVLFFKAPASFTGEDVVELHLHGSIAVVNAVLSVLEKQPETRIAEPGEFTRRALENNKLDLTQVEGLADLIEAETEAQRKQAFRVLSGALGNKVEQWRTNLIRAAALLEATIDFADEEVPVDVTPEVNTLLSGVTQDLAAEIRGTRVAERLRHGFEVAIVGPPNAGKSTLLNRLAGREAAITSEIAGTTRDVIEVRMDLDGLPITFLDTAGLREGADEIEAMGIARARERAQAADIRVFLSETLDDVAMTVEDHDIHVTPKADLRGGEDHGVSGKTGQGVSELMDRVQSYLATRVQSAGLATHARHRVAMEKALEHLTATAQVLSHGPDLYDIAAEELRTAIRSLEALVGRIDVDNLLDEIFASFCLGK
jgi:tRNA modification GTPase